MTTIREIITDALEELSEIALGQTPSAEESQKGLDRLQGMYDGWANGGSFGSLSEVVVTSDYTAAEQERVLINTADAVDITLPDTIVDAYSGATRPVRDLSLIQIVDPLSAVGSAGQTYIYDGFQAAWVRIDSLSLDDAAPLAGRDRYGLAATLALQLAGNRIAVGRLTEAAAARFAVRLSSKLSRPVSATQAEYF